MSPSAARNTKRPNRLSLPVNAKKTWKLEDAKARFSEVVRLAATDGPQLVTVRGKEAAVILAPEEYRRLMPKPKVHVPLVEFLQGLGLDGIDLTREHDTGREIDL